MPRRLTQPPNTDVYDVKSSDTVASIALRYGTTPTELTRLNHLSTSMLFPGQTLFVPGKKTGDDSKSPEKKELQVLHEIGNETTKSINISHSPVKRLHSPVKESAFSPDHSLERLLGSIGTHKTLEEDEISTKYLKIKSKYVTDGQGVVSGVLLVTPQTVMFNPCVSDHLVMDRGREMYMVRLSLKAISRLTFFEDIAAMVVGDITQQYLPNSRFIDYNAESIPKPGVVVCERSGEVYLLDPKLLEKQQQQQNKNENKTSTTDEYIQDTILDLNLTQFHENSSENLKNTILTDNNTTKNDKTDNFSESGIHSDPGIITSLPSMSTSEHNDDDTLTSPSNIDSIPTHDTVVNKQDLSVFINESHSSSTPKHSVVSGDLIANKLNDHVITETIKNIDTITETVNESTNENTEKVISTNPNLDNLISTNQNIDINLISASFKENVDSMKIENAKELNKPSDHSEVISPGSDFSKDSGISDVNTTTFSHQDSHENLHSHQNTCHHQPLSTRCSLSNEAQQWLGKRGIRLSSMDSDDVNVSSVQDDISEEVLIRPASKYEDHLMYVAIKVHKNFWYTNRTRINSVMGIPPNRDQKRRQHWFAIPKERVDQFYSFLLHWAPDISVLTTSAPSTPSSEDFLDSEELNDITNIVTQCSRRQQALNIVDNTFSHSPSPATTLGYEKLHEDDASSMPRRFGSINSVSSKASSVEDDSPELQAESQLLTRLQVRLLARCLPKRTVGHAWELVYSTNLHGISLATLYRNFQDYDNSSLLVVKDQNQKIFGAFLSEVPRMSDGFYGTGESMLFSFVADNKVTPYHWSGDNNFFIKGSKTSLAIGGGEGVFGLWLDEDLYHGRSHACQTFENDTLSYHEDFICTGLEAWAFT